MLVSGVTVLIAMAGMLFAGNGIFTSIGLGTMLVVFVAMVGSLSVLPALLHRLGDKVDKGQVPYLRRLRRPAGDSRFWAAILRPVLRFPAVAVVVAGGALAAAAIPVLGMHTKLTSFTDLPHSLPIVQTFQRVQQAFPGSQTPVEVVVKARDVTAPQYRKGVPASSAGRAWHWAALRAVPRLRQPRQDGRSHRALDRGLSPTVRCTLCART